MDIEDAELIGENQDVVRAVLNSLQKIHESLGSKMLTLAVEDEKRLLAARREHEGQKKLLHTARLQLLRDKL